FKKQTTANLAEFARFVASFGARATRRVARRTQRASDDDGSLSRRARAVNKTDATRIATRRGENVSSGGAADDGFEALFHHALRALFELAHALFAHAEIGAELFERLRILGQPALLHDAALARG